MIPFVVAALLLAQAGGPRDPVVMLPPPDPATAHWTSHGPSGGQVYEIAVDSTDTQVAYAAVGSGYTNESYRPGGIFKSFDGGSSWTEIGPAETSFFGVAVSRSDPGRVFASSNGALWRSIDGGAEWEMVLSGLYSPATAAIDPADAQHVWVLSEGDSVAWRSLDGGSTWTQMFSAESLGFDSGAPSRLHRTQIAQFGPGDNYELHFTYSDDRGETWTLASAFGNQSRAGQIVSDPSDPNRIYAAGDYLVFRSTDRGVSWTQLPNDLGGLGLAVDPRLPDILYGTNGNGLFVSRDAGVTWTLAFDALAGSVAAVAIDGATRVFTGTYRGLFSSDDLRTWVNRNAGLRGAPWQALAVDPGNPSTLYAVGLDFAKSQDAGASWSQGSLSPAAGAAIAVDPSNPSRILSAGWSAGIVRSRDAGATWETVFSPGSNASAIVFDHANPSIVYATVFYPLKSTDGGETWRNVYHGVESYHSGPITIDSGDSALLYLVANARFVFRSADAGENWVLDNGLDYTYLAIQAVVADSGRPGVVWLGTSSGLLRGSSYDTVWNPTGFIDSVSAIAADGSADGALYVASGSGAVFRSLDEGATWEPMGTGLPHVIVYALLVDPKSGILYAATNDGVYSLDLRRRPHVVPSR